MLLQLSPKPSTQLQYFIVFAYLGAILSVLFLTISILAKTLIIIFCLLSWYYAYMKHIKLRHKHSIKMIRNNGDEHWQLSLNSETLDAKLLGSSLLTGSIVLLNFQRQKSKKKHSVVLLKDSLPAAHYMALTRHLFSGSKLIP